MTSLSKLGIAMREIDSLALEISICRARWSSRSRRRTARPACLSDPDHIHRDRRIPASCSGLLQVVGDRSEGARRGNPACTTGAALEPRLARDPRADPSRAFGLIIGAAGDQLELQTSQMNTFLAHADTAILESPSNGIVITGSRDATTPLIQLSSLERSFLAGPYSFVPSTDGRRARQPSSART